MTGFGPRDGTWWCDGVALGAVARDVGTPCYVYSAADIRERYRRLDRALTAELGDIEHSIHYALKANSTLALTQLLRGAGASADANSVGEIEVALRAGFIPSQIVFTGVGKTSDELERAVSLGLKAINAESRGELARIDSIARGQGTRARVALRINPDVDAGSHPHISTGLKRNKFGVPLDEARDIALAAAALPGLELVGVHVHIGSQVTTLDPLQRAADALRRSRRAICRLRASASNISTWAAGWASPTTERRCPTSSRTPRSSAKRPAPRDCRWSSSPADGWWRPPAPCSHGSSTPSRRPATGDSWCWTPG